MNTDLAHNLLHEKVFRARNGPDVMTLSLPGVLAALSRGDVEDFTALRPHQRHAWHAFLVQLAAIALDQSGRGDLPLDTKIWRKLLLTLTNKAEEPWCLFVADLGKPAFMQPPVPEGKLDKWKAFPTPGDLGILGTSKNHDVKIQLVAQPDLEHWVFALVSLQTMEGYTGPRNYGIARMNGGHSSRPSVAYGTSENLSSRFCREVPIVLAERPKLRNGDLGYPRHGGHALLWALPWDGKKQLSLDLLDPHFIEVCRRVRALDQGQGLSFVGTSTKNARIAAKELNGCTGDPWTPIDKSAHKALTVSNLGFDYRLTSRLLFSGDFKKPAAQSRVHDDEGRPVLFLAEVMTRGEGKTEGLHFRSVPIPPKVTSLFRQKSELELLALQAEERIKLVETARNKLLNPAICAVLQGAPEKLNFEDNRTRPWLEHLDQEVDQIFFEALFRDVDLAPDEAHSNWSKTVFELAEEQLDDAIESAPQPSIRRYRVIHRAKTLFHGAARKHLPHLKLKEQP